jgi:hypothetical protein
VSANEASTQGYRRSERGTVAAAPAKRFLHAGCGNAKELAQAKKKAQLKSAPIELMEKKEGARRGRSNMKATARACAALLLPASELLRPPPPRLRCIFACMPRTSP